MRYLYLLLLPVALWAQRPSPKQLSTDQRITGLATRLKQRPGIRSSGLNWLALTSKKCAKRRTALILNALVVWWMKLFGSTRVTTMPVDGASKSR